MLQGIFGTYSPYGAYRGYLTGQIARAAGASGSGPVGQVGPIARTAAVAPEVMSANAGAASAVKPTAVGASTAAAPAAQPMAASAASASAQPQPSMFFIPDAANNKYTAPEMAVRNRILPYEKQPTIEQSKDVKPGQAIKADGMEELKDAECQTCKERKYQDESDDASVSFQSPQSINPSALASTVRGHEMEHVRNEQSKATREERKVVSQSVTLHSAICPECGKAYVSGGTTKTVTMSDNSKDFLKQQAKEEENDPFQETMKFPA